MKMEYDPARDLLYIWFGVPGTKAARTKTVMPVVYGDFDRDGKLLGLEVVDASDVSEQRVQFEVTLEPTLAQKSAA